jgi:flagellar biosynthesis regulator FlaF
MGDFKEETGEAILTAVEPFIREMTTWVIKLTDAKSAANDLMAVLRKKNAGEELSLNEQITLQEQKVKNIRSQIAAAEVNERVGWGAVKATAANAEALAAELRANENYLGVLIRRKAEQDEINNGIERTNTNANETVNHLDNLKNAYAKTHEGQVANIESQIEYFETFKKGPMVVAVLKMLREEYDLLTASEKDAAYAVIDSMTTVQRFARQTTEVIKEENSKRKASLEDYLSVTNNMTSSISTLWSNYYQRKINAAEDGSEEEKRLMRNQAIAQRNWASFQAIINTAAAVTKTMASVAYPFNIPLAVSQGVAGGLQIAAIQSQPLPAFANGADFTTNGPQTIVVGEKGRERVRIDPQPDSRIDGMTIIMNGNVYGPGGAEEFADYIVKAINRGHRAGRVEAFE